MGILDSKTRILDLQLTDYGRNQLSKGLLNFTYFSFGDEGMDYSGSLGASKLLASASYDEFMHRNFSLESDQRKNGFLNTSAQNTNLKSFLYTVPVGSPVLPTFYMSVSGSSSLQRQYQVSSLSTLNPSPSTLLSPITVIARATVPADTAQDKIIGHVYDQNIRQVVNLLSQGQNVTGIAISKNFIILDANRALNIVNGTIADVSSIISYYASLLGFSTSLSPAVSQPTPSGPQPTTSSGPQPTTGGTVNPPAPSGVVGLATPVVGRGGVVVPPINNLNANVSDQLEFVMGLDSLRIDLALQTNKNIIVSKSGFMVEVFNSGTDGTLIKMYKDNVVDPISNQATQPTFNGILSLGVDI